MKTVKTVSIKPNEIKKLNTLFDGVFGTITDNPHKRYTVLYDRDVKTWAENSDRVYYNELGLPELAYELSPHITACVYVGQKKNTITLHFRTK